MNEFVAKNKKTLILLIALLAVAAAAFFFMRKEPPPQIAQVVTEHAPEVYVEPQGLFSCRADSDCIAIHTPEKCDCNHGGKGFMAINKDNKEYYEKFNLPPTNEGCEASSSVYATCKANLKVECYEGKCYAERGVDELLSNAAQANIPVLEQLSEQGVALTSTDRDGRNAVYYAAVNDGRESENLRTIEFLTGKNIQSDESLYSDLVKRGRLITADYFLQNTKMPKTISLSVFLELFDNPNPLRIDSLQEKQDFLLRNDFYLANFNEEVYNGLRETNPNAVLYLEQEGDRFKLDKEKKDKKEALLKLFKENPVAKIQKPDTDTESFKMLINIYEAAANEMPYEIASHYKNVIGYIVSPLSERVRLNSSLSDKEKAQYNNLAKNIKPISSTKISKYFDCRKPFICWRKKVYLTEGGTAYMWQPFCQNGCYYDILEEKTPPPSPSLIPIADLGEFNNWALQNSIIGDDAPATP